MEPSDIVGVAHASRDRRAAVFRRRSGHAHPDGLATLAGGVPEADVEVQLANGRFLSRATLRSSRATSVRRPPLDLSRHHRPTAARVVRRTTRAAARGADRLAARGRSARVPSWSRRLARLRTSLTSIISFAELLIDRVPPCRHRRRAVHEDHLEQRRPPARRRRRPADPRRASGRRSRSIPCGRCSRPSWTTPSPPSTRRRRGRPHADDRHRPGPRWWPTRPTSSRSSSRTWSSRRRSSSHRPAGRSRCPARSRRHRGPSGSRTPASASPPRTGHDLRSLRLRARNASTTAGTGLGLAIVRSLVGLHHGTVVLQTASGEGTTVTVRIPMPEEEGER